MRMCGRYSHSDKMGEIADLVRMARVDLRARYNIAPMQEAMVVVGYEGHGALSRKRWGLVPHWARDAGGAAKLINARSETAAEKPAFRNAFRLRRCLVIADGWFEWQTIGRAKLPWRVCAARGEGLLTFAGLHETWRHPPPPGMDAMDGQALDTFTILTTEAAPGLEWMHLRMPCVIHRHDRLAWLDPATPPARLHEMLLPADAADFQTYRVTPRMNSPRFEDPAAIQPLNEPGLFAG